jgi:hypothetical protein
MHIFHKWVYYDRCEDYIYMGEPCIRGDKAFRICDICGKVQEYIDGNEDHYGHWVTLDSQQAMIFMDVIDDEEKMNLHSLQERV